MNKVNSKKADPPAITFSSNGGNLPPIENESREKLEHYLSDPLIPDSTRKGIWTAVEELYQKLGINGTDLADTMVEEYKNQQRKSRVDHPSHYTWLKDLCGIEVIDITRHMDFDLGNATKYILRQGHKSEEGMSDKEKAIEDLEKAIWYIKDKIEMLKKEE